MYRQDTAVTRPFEGEEDGLEGTHVTSAAAVESFDDQTPVTQTFGNTT